MKYPYIGTSKYSGKIVLFSSMSNGLDLDDVNKTYTVNWHESAFLNVTPKYLQNTYGEVVSPEHAEFIIELCESNGIKTKAYRYSAMSFFMIVKGELYFYSDETMPLRNKCKKITIPLPTKTERESNRSAKPNSSVSKVNRDIDRNKQSTTLTTEEETELKSRAMASELDRKGYDPTEKMKNILSEHREIMEKSKPWPQVGDHALIQRGAKVTVRCIVGDLAWCACPESSMNMITVNLSNLSKPKSKEDLLIEELQNKLVNNNAVDSYILACDIINGDIDGLSYVGDKKSDTKD